MNRPDREAAREEVKDYLEKNRNIEKMHTYVRKMLANVLKELGLHQSVILINSIALSGLYRPLFDQII